MVYHTSVLTMCMLQNEQNDNCWIKQLSVCEIWSFHDSEDSSQDLGCDTM